MDEEITALENDETCESVDRSRGKKPADCMWIYKVKQKLDDTLDRYRQD